MSGIQSEISRLGHKDPRTRRKAVRALFDFNSEIALEGFIPLLEDKDSWFRSKAIDAHRKWAKTEDDLLALVNRPDIETKRIAAELLENIEAPEIAKKLLRENDNTTRSFAAKALASEEELHSTMALDEHHSVRVIAAEFSKDQALISTLIEDLHSTVRRAAIATAVEEGMELKEETIEKAMSSSDPSLRALTASLCVLKGGEMLRRACSDSNPKVRNMIAETLREKVEQVDDRIQLVAKYAPSIIVRWLRSNHEEAANELRWSLIENIEIDSRTRSKLLEQMLSKTDIDQKRVTKLTEDDSPLVRLAANNLSASISELKGEDI